LLLRSIEGCAWSSSDHVQNTLEGLLAPLPARPDPLEKATTFVDESASHPGQHFMLGQIVELAQ